MIAWLPLLSGCTTRFPEELLGLKVTEAHLEKVTGAGMMVIGGGWSGSGDLVGTTVSGEELRVPVSLSSTSVGMLFDMGLRPGGQIDLRLPQDELPASRVFGTYRGSRESLVILLGASGTHVENEHGVRIDETAFEFGIGVSVAWTWFHIAEAGDSDLTEDHTADTGLETGLETAPTGDTEETGGS